MLFGVLLNVLHAEFLIFRYIIFHVIDKNIFNSNDSLGQVIIDLMTFNPDHGLHDNFRLADLVSDY